ncbi:hypothetical protein QYF36_022523 [Acer negundo]|nr:hypothetical protein QYF36_022523 [Acer negundo]
MHLSLGGVDRLSRPAPRRRRLSLLAAAGARQRPSGLSPAAYNLANSATQVLCLLKPRFFGFELQGSAGEVIELGILARAIGDLIFLLSDTPLHRLLPEHAFERRTGHASGLRLHERSNGSLNHRTLPRAGAQIALDLNCALLTSRLAWNESYVCPRNVSGRKAFRAGYVCSVAKNMKRKISSKNFWGH